MAMTFAYVSKFFKEYIQYEQPYSQEFQLLIHISDKKRNVFNFHYLFEKKLQSKEYKQHSSISPNINHPTYQPQLI